MLLADGGFRFGCGGMETLERLEREIDSLDTGRMEIRVKGTHVYREIFSFLKERHSI